MPDDSKDVVVIFETELYHGITQFLKRGVFSLFDLFYCSLQEALRGTFIGNLLLFCVCRDISCSKVRWRDDGKAQTLFLVSKMKLDRRLHPSLCEASSNSSALCLVVRKRGMKGDYG
jgi:hypothetical protein